MRICWIVSIVCSEDAKMPFVYVVTNSAMRGLVKFEKTEETTFPPALSNFIPPAFPVLIPLILLVGFPICHL
jgi:hypothetical protein